MRCRGLICIVRGVTPGDELRWRPLGLPDVRDLATLLAAAEAVEQTGGEFRDVDELAEELADPAIEPAVDTLAGYRDTELVAYGQLLPRPSAAGAESVLLEGAVHPRMRRRGVGAHLVRWQIESGTRWLSERYPGLPCELHVQVHEPNQGKRELYEQHGFTARRWFLEMIRDLTDLPAGADNRVNPAGLTVVPFAPEHEAGTYAVYLTAMAGRVAGTEPDQASWRRQFTGNRKFRPGLSFVALSGAGDVAAYVLMSEYGTDPAARAGRAVYGSGIGTLPRWRGFGVGDALMRRAMAAARAAGYSRMVGMVDRANPTDMQGLVERLGYTPTQTVIRYVRQI